MTSEIFKVVSRENILYAGGTKMLKVVANRPILSVVCIVFGPFHLFLKCCEHQHNRSLVQIESKVCEMMS